MAYSNFCKVRCLLKIFKQSFWKLIHIFTLICTEKKSVSYLFAYIFITVMLRFANGLMVNDPLQTLYQYMTGRQPNAVKECADANWGDWRPHLAMILSNAGAKKSNELDKRSILTLGETLTEKGWFY